MKTFIACWNILLKDMRNYYLKPPNISWGIIFPFAWMLMIFVRSGNSLEIQQVFCGIVALSVLFGTTSMLSVTITFERKARSFERLLIAPVSTEWLVVAKITGAILFGILNSFIPAVFCVLYFKAIVANWTFFMMAVILLSVTSTLLGLVISVSATEVFEAQTYSNFFRFPMIFLCGLFIPVNTLPAILQPLSYMIPVTYGVDLLHFSISGNSHMAPGFDIFLVFTCCLGLFYISLYNIRRRWIQ